MLKFDKIKLLMATVFLMAGVTVSAQSKKSELYIGRAQTMYKLIWKYYHKPQYGLFAENFPSSRKADSLNYLQGNSVKEKEVSFLWPYSGMFSATNVLIKVAAVRSQYKIRLDTIVAGMEKYHDVSRQPPGYQAYPVIFEKADRYYDDNGLVGIDYMESYFNTKNPIYLERAKGIFKFIISGWNEDLGGGITWLEGHNDQKPACSNGMATLVALKLYQGTKDPYYLNWGKKFYGWMYKNLRDSSGIYVNDKKPDGSVNRTFWTYNSGSMLEAGVLLYRFTGDKQYLKQAQAVAQDTYKHFSQEKHDSHLNMRIDLPWFVTVLFRGYEALYHEDGNYGYISSIEEDLNYAWLKSRDKYGLVTHSWAPRTDELNKPKWLLDEACIAELYARLGLLDQERTKSRR
jgi:hypothetical protein